MKLPIGLAILAVVFSVAIASSQEAQVVVVEPEAPRPGNGAQLVTPQDSPTGSTIVVNRGVLTNNGGVSDPTKQGRAASHNRAASVGLCGLAACAVAGDD